MYKIGLFSKINKITIKTLRHYDEIGLLRPAHIDIETGYRYYSSEQLPKTHKIICLRQMGFSLEEIIAIVVDGEDATKYFEKRKEELVHTISQNNQQLSQINNYLKELKGGTKMEYKVIIKELPEVIVASMRQVIPDYNALFDLCPNVMAKEMQRVGCVCAVPAYCFNIYHDGEYKEKDVDVEICESVTEMKPDTDILNFKRLDKVPTAACVYHKGDYSKIGKSYGEVLKWIEDNGYTISGNPRESYIDGIWNKDNVDDWLTEIQIPIAK
ncbi:MAG: MerR family transcriptional regulator [Ignavibacteriales bacterium]